MFVQPPFDRDFPSLAGRSNVGKSWHSGTALPEQQWTRLANAPDGSALSPRVSNPRVAEPPLVEPAKPFAPKQGAGPAELPAASHTRMADTVQQVGLALVHCSAESHGFEHVTCIMEHVSTWNEYNFPFMLHSALCLVMALLGMVSKRLVPD